MKLID